MKYFLIIIFFLLSINTQASMKSMYVAGGCFWCVEEVYEKIEGVLSVYSGYSGGHVENPTYQEVVLGNTGHIEAAEINYDSSLVSEEQLVKLLFLNIDPFDEGGQFCDRGYSYKSAFFTSDENLKKMINNYILKIENNHNQKVQTLILPFKNFYLAEDYHQDYYQKKYHGKKGPICHFIRGV